jgi:DNA-directed RNA polymerase subunit RPC12/RpoP
MERKTKQQQKKTRPELIERKCVHCKKETTHVKQWRELPQPHISYWCRECKKGVLEFEDKEVNNNGK